MDAARGRVLLVDDDAFVRKAYARLLEFAGFAVTSADRVAGAVALLDTTVFDVVVTDLAMPGGGGVALMRALRARHHAARVVVLSGSPSEDLHPELAAELRTLGVFRHLLKPARREVLVATVTAALVAVL